MELYNLTLLFLMSVILVRSASEIEGGIIMSMTQGFVTEYKSILS